jgi:hypothetical protein
VADRSRSCIGRSITESGKLARERNSALTLKQKRKFTCCCPEALSLSPIVFAVEMVLFFLVPLFFYSFCSRSSFLFSFLLCFSFLVSIQKISQEKKKKTRTNGPQSYRSANETPILIANVLVRFDPFFF